MVNGKLSCALRRDKSLRCMLHGGKRELRDLDFDKLATTVERQTNCSL